MFQQKGKNTGLNRHLSNEERRSIYDTFESEPIFLDEQGKKIGKTRSNDETGERASFSKSRDIILPLGIEGVINDAQETAKILAKEELRAMIISSKDNPERTEEGILMGNKESVVESFTGNAKRIEAVATPILEEIAQESFENYTKYDENKDADYLQHYIELRKKTKKKESGQPLTEEEVNSVESHAKDIWSSFSQEDKADTMRSWAIKNASQSGIDRASDLIEAITGEKKNAQDVLANVTLDDLIIEVAKNIPEQLPIDYLDKGLIKKIILNFASDKDNWLSDEEIRVIKHIFDKKGISQEDAQALMIATTGVHVSWAAIQGPRTVIEQSEAYNNYC